MAQSSLGSDKIAYPNPQLLYSRAREGQQLLRLLRRLPQPHLNSWSALFGNSRACKSPTRPITRGAQKLVRRRTSEHWWQEDEEFDAITEVVVPKRLHLAAPAAPAGDEGTVWGPLSEAALRKMLAASRGTYSSGFSSTKAADVCVRLVLCSAKRKLRRCGGNFNRTGPLFLKKVHTCATLDVLEL
ncbi:hypothetical protein Vafri_13390 [Volvox africanus]|nr:hypothetical protein Vafri_13390 [Volvox africanus]